MIDLRTLELQDIPNLVQIRPTYITDTILVLARSGSGLEVGWQLVEKKLPEPFDKGTLYDFTKDEQDLVYSRLLRPDETYQRVAEYNGRLVGLVEVELQDWNNTAHLANIMIDLDYRGKGLGRRLWHRALDFARQSEVRGIMIETQNTNVAACRFYERMGCQLVGLNEMLYTNDGATTEIALFWYYPLRSASPAT
jgi:streptothricin acetyltransferase